MVKPEDYWQIPAEHTRVKSEIVVKYFMAWSKVLRATNSDLVYLDLCAGQAKHDNGEFSTCMKIVEEASRDQYLRDKLRIILNDMDRTKYKSLVSALEELKYGKCFHIEPLITNEEVNLLMAAQLSRVKPLPTFCFIDPYGYKGITIDLIKAVIKNFGCDCVIFFHTNGINRNLLKGECRNDIDGLFGKEGLSRLLKRITDDQEARLGVILDEFCKACKSVGAVYVQPFQFNFPKSQGISHHLIFLTKSRRGFEIMKNVMAKYSLQEDGLPTFTYIEGWIDVGDQLSLDICGPMHSLKDQLIGDFLGQRVTVCDIIESYNRRGLSYTAQNVKKALGLLERAGLIDVVDKPGPKRRAGTFGDNRVVYFKE